MHFEILGSLRVTDDNERELAVGGSKRAALLAALILRPNEVVSVDRLIDDLWDGRPPASAAKTLQVHMSRLRRALAGGGNGDRGDAIVTRGTGYALDVDPTHIDAERFKQLVTEGSAALAEGAHARASTRLRSALALWRGDALADFTYASFAQDEIARLDALRTVALESAVEAELALGRHAELIPELKMLVKRHPLSEHLRAQLMLALYRSGRQAEALGAYRAARRVLIEQLGIEPSAELRELEQAILEQDAQLAPLPRAAPRRAESAGGPARRLFVGYDRELASLEDALEVALAGQGGLALVGGEPGIGKTRLADELAHVADARGAQVLWGRCPDEGGAPAHWAWIQILRALVAARDPATVRGELGAHGDELMQLVPELADILPELGAAPSADAEEARFRLFDATAAFLKKAGASQPLVIVIDDLHAADYASIAMLRFVAPAVLDAHVLIVGTYRDTEVGPDHPLSQALSELARRTDCVQLVLTGLSGDDTAHFVELSAGIAPMPALATAIHDATSGNPLFVNELVRLLRTEDRLDELGEATELTLPRAVGQVIASRLENLSESCRQTLAVAAVIGGEFDLTLLEHATDAPVEEILDAIDEALAARVVEACPGSDGSFRFIHDLVRHALYKQLGTLERARSHAAVAAAIEQLHPGRLGPVVASLAHHCVAALPVGDAGKAVDYMTLAGEAAAQQSASADAARCYARAAEIARANALPADTVCELCVRHAEELVLVGDLRAARAALDDAQALAEAASDKTRAARVTVARTHLALLDWETVDDDAIEEAIALFRETGDALSEARAWWALFAVSCGRVWRMKEGEAVAQMVDAARRGGSRALTSQAVRALARSLATGAMPISEASRRVGALRSEANDPTTRAHLMCSLGMLAGASGRFDDARMLFAEALASTPEGERANVIGQLLSFSTRVEFLAASLNRAEELARELCAFYENEGLAAYLCSALCYVVDPLTMQGRLEEAEAELARAVPITPDDDWDGLLRQARCRARLELAHGNLDAAESAARESLGYLDETQIADELADSLLVLARVLTAAGRADEAREAATDALRVSEAREHVVFAQQARGLLERQSLVPVAESH
jgi:DNA-binding SARP family transcriptional activator